MPWNLKVYLQRRDVWVRAWYIGLALAISGALWAYWEVMSAPARGLLLGMNLAIIFVLAFQEILGAKFNELRERMHRAKPTMMPPPSPP